MRDELGDYCLSLVFGFLFDLDWLLDRKLTLAGKEAESYE